ncbi:NAD(P)/FAD-dependent oxidoreductase [Salinigranum salinum]|uniref:NAD(P)/FAD-dependent oxidoreductase n=1 Tax=Salinigranum salinum TaxID=1364937 RepID=UPI0012607B83|nr:NAD(P)/FAD-dependent oxidoreductase [Salinigranum salinum]
MHCTVVRRVISVTATTRPRVAVLGGAVGGLATAADRFAAFADVTLFERQSYDDKRVNCGEAITESSVVPLATTPENGFLNRIEGFDLHVYPSTDRDAMASPLASTTITVDEGFVTDRDVVERRWADRLRRRGVDVCEGTNVSVGRYREIVDDFDLVVDATGQPALSLKAAGRTGAYTGDVVALNADVEAASETPHRPDIVFEGHLGYFWVFPKSDRRANVGIGGAGEERPDNYIEELWGACDRFGVPRPAREDGIYTIPRGPSLDPEHTHRNGNVFLVGDAAGIANRYQGEGISQAIRSSSLLADLVKQGRVAEYPRRLHESMRAEYRLATLMRGVWESTEDPELLASVARAIDGLGVEDVTRRPWRVIARIARHPRLLVRLLGIAGVRSRLVDAYTDTWEYDSARRAETATGG